MVKVCFVCLGNICRSPTAEGVMKHLVVQHGLVGSVEADSAGTIGHHAGEPPDARARAAARRRGIEVGGRSRRFERSDWDEFDYVIAMDEQNLADLTRMAPSKAHRGKLALLLAFDPASSERSVPDPYYGDGDGFERVLDLCTAGCEGLLDHIRRERGL